MKKKITFVALDVDSLQALIECFEEYATDEQKQALTASSMLSNPFIQEVEVADVSTDE